MPPSQGVMLTVFEANNADFKNRKRAARACAQCQKRKKKCAHTFAQTTDQQAEKDTAEKVLPQLSHKEPVKFVGDLNPESVLTDLTQRSKDSPRYSRVGIWVEQSRLEQEQFRRQQEAAARNGIANNADASDITAKKQAAVHRYSKVERGRRTLTGHQKNYLQAVGALRVLPKATQDALVTTYVACIDPLFPVIACKKLLQDYTNGEASVFLIQAICLVACKTQEAVPYLRLYEDGPLMDPIPFARALHTGLDAAMKADLEADRFTKVQILTLMSLHNDGPGGIEESSLHLVMAIHDAQTTGLHINTPGRTPNDEQAMLWWTLWTLDKFNACLGGRPLMIAERDIDIDRPSVEPNARSQTMAVWLEMGNLLDRVIEYYRPGVDLDTAGWEDEFPSFQDLTQNCAVNLLGDSQRNLLEIAYNIIGILSCRAGGPTSRSYQRRIVAADRIQKLTARGRQAHLPPIPLVPYAISLSLTVAYRGLRDGHSDPVKAQADLASRCDILESLNKTWWTADAMAKLGRKALKSLQQPSQTEDGRRSNSGLDVGDTLEAEVAVCKYGPFHNEKEGPDVNMDEEDLTGTHVRPSVDGNHRALKEPSSTPLAAMSADRLQVLSQAAAQFGVSNGKRNASMHFSDLTLNDSNERSAGGINTASNKRPRYDSSNSSHPPSSKRQNTFSPHDNHMMTDTPPSTTQVSTLTNTPAQTPLTTSGSLLNGSRQHVTANDRARSDPHTGVFEINPLLDPFCATTDLNPESSTNIQVQGSSNTLPAVTLATSMNIPSTDVQQPQLYNPRMSVPLHYQANKDLGPIDIDMYNYNDLDNLFDGFFDLSMPTMFEDPLFEGSSFDQFSFNYFTGGGLGSGGPSGAGSVDMSYMPQQNNMNNSNGQQQAQYNSVGRGWQGQGTTMNMNEVNISNGNMNMIGTGRRHRNRNSLSMNTMNKISPDSGGGGANHWCWNEDDF
ncbi:hypothetical protein LTR05_006154 [Lithohypha guttulata]|uniref:Xylanolytic transcriptional activator regulatory domain-containing protein n=1 Tax=Lithohypha guttulata TaxID=1690604 RepID=A0AAN7SWS1_9EURO|nr:hypothetical protein LTR05_006154 [Lithohypha guttulata]